RPRRDQPPTRCSETQHEGKVRGLRPDGNCCWLGARMESRPQPGSGNRAARHSAITGRCRCSTLLTGLKPGLHSKNAWVYSPAVPLENRPIWIKQEAMDFGFPRNTGWPDRRICMRLGVAGLLLLPLTAPAPEMPANIRAVVDSSIARMRPCLVRI